MSAPDFAEMRELQRISDELNRCGQITPDLLRVAFNDYRRTLLQQKTRRDAAELKLRQRPSIARTA